MSYSGKTIVVLGLGKSGLAAAKLLLRRGAKVIAYDENPEAKSPISDPNFTLVAGPLVATPPQGVKSGEGSKSPPVHPEPVEGSDEPGGMLNTAATRSAFTNRLPVAEEPRALRQAQGERGATSTALPFWHGADAIIVSPGVPLSRPELVAANSTGTPMYGEIELAFRALPPGAGPILGITGTNGKSTTTALLGALVSAHLPNTFVGGNLGTAFTVAVEDPARPPYAMHVVELSSFQLEGVQTAQFKGAAILNLTPDHLDRYPSHEAYGAAKARIFANQPLDGFAVVNADDPQVVRLARDATVPVYGFTMDAKITNAGFQGLAVGAKDKFILAFGQLPVFTLRNRALRGTHNVQNAMAAGLLAHLAGIPFEAIQRGLDAFPGLPHRLEFVRELNGVEWINDSKATNVDSSLVALAALPGNIWLIAGGKGKGAPYQPLVEAAKGKVKGVLTIGKDAPAIAQAFSEGFAVFDAGTLANAVQQARKLAQPHDIVLLSPACASYDQFKHFEHRGDAFKALVGDLA